MRLERRMSDMNKLFHKVDAKRSPENPSITIGGDEQFGTPLLNAALMRNAESGKRRWASIGVDEWIQAGRWWLLKMESSGAVGIRWLTTEQSQSACYIGDTSNRRLSKQGYTDIIKASWILIDVIARHPQMSLLDSDVRYEAELLAKVVPGALYSIDEQLLIPNLLVGNQNRGCVSGCFRPGNEIGLRRRHHEVRLEHLADASEGSCSPAGQRVCRRHRSVCSKISHVGDGRRKCSLPTVMSCDIPPASLNHSELQVLRTINRANSGQRHRVLFCSSHTDKTKRRGS